MVNLLVVSFVSTCYVCRSLNIDDVNLHYLMLYGNDRCETEQHHQLATVAISMTIFLV